MVMEVGLPAAKVVVNGGIEIEIRKKIYSQIHDSDRTCPSPYLKKSSYE